MFPANAQSELPSLFAAKILLRLVVQPAHPRSGGGSPTEPRFLTDPDAIVERAEILLSSKTSTWEDLAVGLGVVIGRRLSELLGLKTKLEPKTEFSVSIAPVERAGASVFSLARLSLLGLLTIRRGS